MHELQHRRWRRLFVGVACLVLAQIAWWTVVFLNDVTSMAALRTENLALQHHSDAAAQAVAQAHIEKEHFHRRIMFLSESLFFSGLTIVGLYLLYRALSVEERSREIQRNFIEIVTHESKTPLTAIKLRLEATIEQFGKDSALERELALGLDEVRRLSSIYDKAMNLNRMERQAWHFETLSLSDVVLQVTRRLDPFFRARGARIVLDLQPDTWVRGDIYGLQSLVQSLLENAVLYNPRDKKEVQVQVASQAPRVLLTVRDNGPGIAEVDRDRLFERFRRGETGKGVPGTGLGLYLAKTTVEAHQGSIRLAESGDGTQGAVFEVQLPLAGEAA